MFLYLTRALGLAPEAPKTGSREAVVAMLSVTLILTTVILTFGWWNVPWLEAAFPLLLMLWPSTIGMWIYAFKLKSDKIKSLDIGDIGKNARSVGEEPADFTVDPPSVGNDDMRAG